MELEVAKKLIAKYIDGHMAFVGKALVAERYYHSQNDIKFKSKKKEETSESVLRNADNRIAHGFHKLLVDQKTGYTFTVSPLFDTQDDATNKIVNDTLGDTYDKKLKSLCINASNAGIGWLHYWSDDVDGFSYEVVPSEQVIPVWSPKLGRKLLAVLRVYKDYDEEGNLFDVYEYWNEKECWAYRKRADDTLERGLMAWACFTDFYAMGASEAENQYKHAFGRIPFIPFFNNDDGTGDLADIKDLIDAYDKTYSGFMNDLEDIQEVILVLTNYGGEDYTQFISDLKEYKTIQMESQGDGDKSGVSTLTIEIPVAAREKMLEITRKAIFQLGQGIDPEQQGMDKTSGEAMKFLYALLETKAGLLETEFKMGLAELVRAICDYNNKKVEKITQTWTRTSIRNDAELVDMCSKSEGVISRKTILKNHPFVESAEDEEVQIAEEEKEKEAAARDDIYAEGNNQIGFAGNHAAKGGEGDV